ncbi:MAG: hypothetical protein A2941_01200 [Candidatus Yanofskybacteria bacterium RIFCSPLOWO2_01_FULL_49_17]|uniref:Glycosyl transferase family 1 domain-containing protein n=1 Tax=Candidatus Yanofskybacteria bacterium RIFCSPLOWO2_01_FULL_49_17 TaxID=1802700 RepID=A0A1F8GQ74_9BACT|nr:MAG: hypothetical protein A2941_01200 [Candidatus Yanofskybacteria bacterium RIFCSPLOWO2_01_FULL_49_17]
MKLALVHDWIRDMSGAERVLVELHKIYPQAPIYTLFYDEKFTRQILPGADIRASFLQKFPLVVKYYRLAAALMPAAIESLDLSDFDIVLSSSVIFSKGLVLRPTTRHICYCYSPTRQIWDLNAKVQNTGSRAQYFGFWSLGFKNSVGKHLLRLWDRSAAERPTEFVAISQTVADRIKKYYRRDSRIVYPPVTINKSVPKPSSSNSRELEEEYYLIVSRLFPHKNVGIAIEAFNKIGYPLVIIGDGPERKKLQHMAGKNITFLGGLDDVSVSAYYAACRAFIMPQEEDFGLTAVEAMSYGKPIIALRKGGATETVVEGMTGEFFDDPIPEGLDDAVRRLNENYPTYNSEIIKSHAAKFSSNKFREAISKLVA